MQQKKKYLLIVMSNYFPQNMSEFLLKPIVSRSHDDVPFPKHNILSPLSSLVTTGNKGKKGGNIFL